MTKKNEPVEWGNGIYDKYKNPVVTAAHVPLEWKYDFNEQDNPYLMQRIMCNAALNAGALKWQGKYLLVVRVEGADRKSFFAVAESPNGIDNFRFWEEPITMPDDVIPATNIYDNSHDLRCIDINFFHFLLYRSRHLINLFVDV